MQRGHVSLGNAQLDGLEWTVKPRAKRVENGIFAENLQIHVWHFVKTFGNRRDRRENLETAGAGVLELPQWVPRRRNAL